MPVQNHQALTPLLPLRKKLRAVKGTKKFQNFDPQYFCVLDAETRKKFYFNFNFKFRPRNFKLHLKLQAHHVELIKLKIIASGSKEIHKLVEELALLEVLLLVTSLCRGYFNFNCKR